MNKVAGAVFIGLVMVVSSMGFATASDAGCTSSVYYKGRFKIIEEKCFNPYSGNTVIKQERVNSRNGRVVVIKKVVDPWGCVKITKRATHHGGLEWRRHGRNHWRGARWARWHRGHHRW